MKHVRTTLVVIVAGGVLYSPAVLAAAQDGQNSNVDYAAQDQAACIRSSVDASGYRRRSIPGSILKRADGNIKDYQEKIDKLRKDEAKQLNSLSKERDLSREQKMEKAQQIREATQTKIKLLLPPEQLVKYEQSMANRKALRETLSTKDATAGGGQRE